MAPPILVPVRDHTKLQKVGTNTHDEIDTYINATASLKTISALVTRIIPAGSHGQVITAYNDKMIIEGILQVDGTFLFMDLGD